jgi:uncharacterized protein
MKGPKVMDGIAVSPELQADDSFRFSCDKGLQCFNMCCRDINLYLTPYDILRIKKRLNLSAREFLKTYTIPLFPKEIGHPLILLRMVPDNLKSCPFVSGEGCMIYEDRPWSCRSFPLEPADGSTPPRFRTIKRDFCLGFDHGKVHTVGRWRSTQSVTLYEEMNEAWKQITHHRNFSSQDFLDGRGRDIFFLGSYNLDEFRNVVLTGEFQNYFEVSKNVLKNIKSNETELLKFAFKWVLHVLFGEDTLKRR